MNLTKINRRREWTDGGASSAHIIYLQRNFVHIGLIVHNVYRVGQTFVHLKYTSDSSSDFGPFPILLCP